MSLAAMFNNLNAPWLLCSRRACFLMHTCTSCPQSSRALMEIAATAAVLCGLPPGTTGLLISHWINFTGRCYL